LLRVGDLATAAVAIRLFLDAEETELKAGATGISRKAPAAAGAIDEIDAEPA